MRDKQENSPESIFENKYYVDYVRYYVSEWKPEYGTYQIKTRPPQNSKNWRFTMYRKIRDQRLSSEAMLAARLKCHSAAKIYARCSYEHPFKESTMCKSQFKDMNKCFSQERDIELDKRRRDIVRNNELWWKNIYNEQGETGLQAKDFSVSYTEKAMQACFWVKDQLFWVIGLDTD
jgi:hypothetical protein